MQTKFVQNHIIFRQNNVIDKWVIVDDLCFPFFVYVCLF